MISIVDDDESVREATKCLVRSLGYDAATFCSAEEFLGSGHVTVTACLITDVQMPGLSGVELQAALANRGFRIPTIFMTAFPDESVRRRAMDAGAVGFLHKPFNGKALIQFIQDAISQGGGKA